MTLATGECGPDFTLVDQHGQDVSLAGLRGRAVLLVFFPFAFSGVCTSELRDLRDRLGDFETPASTVLALSCDPVFTLRAVADRDGLFYPLLSDFWPHGAVASAYGVLDERTGGARRSSYLLDAEGVVRWSVHHPTGSARDLDEHAAALRCV